MNSRDKILNAIAANQPKLVAPPTIDFDRVIRYEDNYTQFKTILENIGAKVELIQDIATLTDQLEAEKASGKLIINTFNEIDKQYVLASSFELEKLEKVCIKATLGVAENGAVWLYESQMMNRILPFICQHLIVVVDSPMVKFFYYF